MKYGLWDQLRTDKGKEWCLSLFINKTLSPHRYSTRKPPHLQTTSRMVSGTECPRFFSGGGGGGGGGGEESQVSTVCTANFPQKSGN